jgi:hypothetical protein
MKTRFGIVPLAITFAGVAAGCAANPNRGLAPSPTTADSKAAPAPAVGHDMAGMSGHDMSAMGSHSSAETAFLFPDGDDKGWAKVQNGNQHTMAPEVPLAKLDAATRVQLLHQLSLTIDVIKKYPTVKDAEAAGYRRAGPFLPGLGTHYVGGKNNRSGTLTDDDILHPSTIIYDGTKPDSPIAGFMYMSVATGPSAKEPEGFAGPNDHWHYHTGVCVTPGGNGVVEALGFDGSITEAECKAKNGRFVAATQYLLHVWTVPGYSNPLGVFGHANPALTCGDGTYYTDNHELTNACRQP